MEDMQQKLIAIESSIAHLEKFTEELNQCIVEQQKRIEWLTTRLESLDEEVSQSIMDDIKSKQTKPPHYQ